MSELSTISFSYGISRNPSLSPQDGALSECVNLVPRNGELVNIKAPVYSGVTLQETETLMAVHSTADGSRYIISRGNAIYWMRTTGGTKTKIADITGSVKVSIMGATLLLLLESGIDYYVWKSGYRKISIKDMAVSTEITTENKVCTITEPTDLPMEGVITKEKLKAVYYEIDQYITGKVNESSGEHFRKIHFGVIAPRLTTGSYAFVSDVFMMGPKNPIYKSFKIARNNGWQFTDLGVRDFFDASIKVQMASVDTDIISAVDVFISDGVTFLDPESVEVSGEYLTLNAMGQSDAMTAFDNVIFRKVLTLSVDDLTSGNTKTIPVPSGGEESISLVDMSRFITKASGTYVYNNRVIAYGISDITSTNPSVLMRTPLQVPNNSIDILGESIPYFTADILTVFDVTRNGISGKAYSLVENVRYPYAHLITYPALGAAQATVYVHIKQDGASTVSTYVKKTFALRESKTRGICNYLNLEDGQPRYIYHIKDGNMADGWSVSNQAEFQAAKVNTEFKRSGLLFTNVNDPFTFPLLNEVKVGGDVIRLTSETLALSQDQFGKYQVTAFTTEGIWSLGVGNDGTIITSSPLTRDVCSNAEGIVQVDNAVIFPTRQGLKILSGGQVRNISPYMEGVNVSERFLRGLVSGYDSIIVEDTEEFRDTLLTCKGAYDYINNMVHFYGTSTKHYILSQDDMQYTSFVGSTVKSVVHGFPGSIIQLANGDIMEYSGETREGVYDGVLLTRPVCIGDPSSLTMIEDSSLVYSKLNPLTKCKVAIYGSNDQRQYFRVSSLRMRPFKWYRFAVFTRLSDKDALTGMTLQTSTARSNKLR